MVIPAELRVIDIFAVIIGRVAVEEAVIPVVVGDKHLKALLLDNDIFQPPGHLPNLRKKSTHIERLTGEAPSGAGVAVAHAHQVSRRLLDIPVVRALPEGCFQLLCFFRQRRRCRSVDDLQLIRQMDGGFIAAVVEVEPAGKLLAGIQRQQVQFQQQLCRTVLHYPEEIHQFPLDVVVDLKFAGFLPQQHSPAAAEDFNIASEFPWEHGQDNRQQVCLVSNAGYGCSDRLSHAPFIIEQAGTVPAVRLPYRPLSLHFFLYSGHLSLNLRRSFIFITPSMVLKHRTSIA